MRWVLLRKCRRVGNRLVKPYERVTGGGTASGVVQFGTVLEVTANRSVLLMYPGKGHPVTIPGVTPREPVATVFAFKNDTEMFAVNSIIAACHGGHAIMWDQS